MRVSLAAPSTASLSSMSCARSPSVALKPTAFSPVPSGTTPPPSRQAANAASLPSSFSPSPSRPARTSSWVRVTGRRKSRSGTTKVVTRGRFGFGATLASTAPGWPAAAAAATGATLASTAPGWPAADSESEPESEPESESRRRFRFSATVVAIVGTWSATVVAEVEPCSGTVAVEVELDMLTRLIRLPEVWVMRSDRSRNRTPTKRREDAAFTPRLCQECFVNCKDAAFTPRRRAPTFCPWVSHPRGPELIIQPSHQHVCLCCPCCLCCPNPRQSCKLLFRRSLGEAEAESEAESEARRD